MKKRLIGSTIILSLALFYCSAFAFAETIIFKWGSKVEARIIEKTDEYIKVETKGTAITYRLEDIESIDGQAPSLFTKELSSPTSTQTSTKATKTPKDIFQTISPAVVYITTQTVTGEEYLGSGFVVDSHGVIVTNYHVIQGAQNINVKFKDGRLFPVTGIIHHDANQDVCIFKIEAQNLPTLTLGNSQDIQIGEKLYCIGNPLGLEYSFSDGMLSGIRDFQGLKFLQFTAPISPGNSGGPLLNPQGQAIGIVTFLMLGGQNLNFALAINEIKPYISTTPKMSFAEFVGKVSQVDYYLYEGTNYALQKDYAQAISAYEKALELNPNSALAYNGLSWANNELKQYQQGITYLEKAIQLDPTYAPAYNNLGFAYDGLGQFQQAIAYYEKAIQLDPTYAPAYNNLGSAYDGLGQFQQAIAYCEKAIQLDPTNAPAYNNLGSAYDSLGQYQQAIAYYEKAIQLDPTKAVVYGNLGFAYQAQGQYNLAQENYQKAKELYQAQGNYQMVQQLEELLKKLP